MDIASIFKSSIPKALDGMIRIAAILWAEDKTYIIAFTMFAIICAFLTYKIKKKNHY